MSLAADAAAYDQAHPEVWVKFQSIVAEYRAAGHVMWSADAAMHAVRWSLQVKIPNAYVAFYARKWLAQNPEAPRFFRTCASAMDAAPSRQMELGV